MYKCDTLHEHIDKKISNLFADTKPKPGCIRMNMRSSQKLAPYKLRNFCG